MNTSDKSSIHGAISMNFATSGAELECAKIKFERLLIIYSSTKMIEFILLSLKYFLVIFYV